MQIDPIQQIVFNCLNNFAYQDAIFLAERLNADAQNEETLYLLSLCNYRSNKVLRAYNLLKSRYLQLPQSKYLLSKCCIDLNKHGEAESVLIECTVPKHRLYDEIVKEYGDYSCFVLQILANIYSKTDRVGQAVEFHKKCLRLNPFLWSSFEALCNFGEKLEPIKYFNLNQALSYYNTTIATKMPLQQLQSDSFWPINATNNVKQQQQTTTANGFCVSDLFDLNEQVLNETDEQLTATTTTTATTNTTTNSTNTSLTSFNSTNKMQTNDDMQVTPEPQQLLVNKDLLIETSAVVTPPPSTAGSSTSAQQLALITAGGGGGGPNVNHHYHHHHHYHIIPPAPPAKKSTTSTALAAAAKRIPPIKPLSGQNNNITSASTSNQQSSSNVRRSSRIFAQNVKENKKSSSSSSSSSSQNNNGGQSTSTADMTTANFINNRRLKLKKKLISSSTAQSSNIGHLNDIQNNLNDENLIGMQQQYQHQQSQHTKLDNQALSQPLQPLLQHQQQQHQSLSTNRNDILNAFNLKFNQNNEDFIRNTIDNAMKLMRDIGTGYTNLSQYECKKAVDTFQQLKSTQYQSSYILSLMGKAYFELHEYGKAEKIYLQLRHLHPYHLEGLEYYSTVLWHLQKEIQLSSLAQELTDYDKLAPETWCVVGNCFSLHKEHDAAIKFFQRATQINPNFVYAYNLLGHEYFLIEEMEKGLSCFRKAIFLDSRHYNAWYGISMIHLKQEKFQLAENYLKKALIINPFSSLLMCHIAVVYHSMRKSDKALEILENAIRIEPKNFLCKFHRASILFSMGKYELALKDFERLRKQIPKESLIYYMISKTHKKLRNIHLSLMYMSWAMDLDPKGVNNQLKENIDKRYVVDNDSTFARELDAINTSTLDEIYGVEVDNLNSIQEGNDDDDVVRVGGGGEPRGSSGVIDETTSSPHSSSDVNMTYITYSSTTTNNNDEAVSSGGGDGQQARIQRRIVHDDDEYGDEDEDDDDSFITSSKHILPSTSNLSGGDDVNTSNKATPNDELSSIAYYAGSTSHNNNNRTSSASEHAAQQNSGELYLDSIEDS